MEAILKYKRKHPDGSGHDVVDVLCPDCEHVSTFGYEGWTAIKCGGCGVELSRPEDFEDRDYRSYPYYVQQAILGGRTWHQQRRTNR